MVVLATEQVESSRGLKALMKLVLTIGNFMNYGFVCWQWHFPMSLILNYCSSNRVCLEDSGLRIKSLEQLQNVRSTDPGQQSHQC